MLPHSDGAGPPPFPPPKSWGWRGSSALGSGGGFCIIRDRRCLPPPRRACPQPPLPQRHPPKLPFTMLVGVAGRGAPHPSSSSLLRCRHLLPELVGNFSAAAFAGGRGRGWWGGPGRGGWAGGQLPAAGERGVPCLCLPQPPGAPGCRAPRGVSRRAACGAGSWRGGGTGPVLSPASQKFPMTPVPGVLFVRSRVLGSVGTWGLPQCNVGLSPVCAGVPQRQ